MRLVCLYHLNVVHWDSLLKQATPCVGTRCRHNTPVYTFAIRNTRALCVLHCCISNFFLLLLLLLQIQRIREQQPDVFQQMLRAAIKTSAEQLGGDAPPFWVWFACEACGQWRLVSDQAIFEMGLGIEGTQFFCSQNVDRPGGRGCEEPAEWVDPVAAV
jgi:hypothetical protein